MIDIHTHILPGFDDGPATIEEALEMAAVAARDGVRCLVATPHDPYYGHAVDCRQVELAVDDLRGALVSAGVEVDVLPGLEMSLTTDIAHRARQGQVLAINRARYLLVELPFQLYPPHTDQCLFELQLQGYVPIIAHPERNAAIQRDVNLLEPLVTRGILAQVTADSLMGSFGPKTRETAEAMLTCYLAHVIASDAHSPTARPPVLSDALRRAAELVGPERANEMVCTIPQAIIAGERFEVPSPVRHRARNRWLSWRITR